jgi:hypothetical protein
MSCASDVEAEAEAKALEAVAFSQKLQRLKVCRFSFHSVSKLLFKFGRFVLTRSYFSVIYLNHVQVILILHIT